MPIRVTEDIPAAEFNCPSSADVPATGATLQEVADSFRKPGYCSYIYLGKGLSDPIAPEVILAVEPLRNHIEEGINVLRGDGTVVWLDQPEAEAVLKKLDVQQPGPATQPQ